MGRKIKAVLFDFDGTIVDTNDIILSSWRAVFIAKGRKPADDKEILASFGEPLWTTMGKWFPGEVEECIDIYRNYQKDIFFDRIALYPGMDETIRKLKALGYLNAIVTSRLTSSTIATLDKYDLTRYFDAVITCDDTDKHKPEAEPALLALGKLGVDPDEAIMIGDSRFDIGCAHNAGVKAVLVDWSLAINATTEKETEPLYVPDYTIKRAEELLDILEGGA